MATDEQFKAELYHRLGKAMPGAANRVDQLVPADQRYRASLWEYKRRVYHYRIVPRDITTTPCKPHLFWAVDRLPLVWFSPRTPLRSLPSSEKKRGLALDLFVYAKPPQMVPALGCINSSPGGGRVTCAPTCDSGSRLVHSIEDPRTVQSLPSTLPFT